MVVARLAQVADGTSRVGDREHRLGFNADLTAGCCALTALAASASDFPVRVYAVLSAWLLQLRRVQRSSNSSLRQQLVDGFGKSQLDFGVV